MSPPILTLREISITYGHHPLLDKVNLSVLEGSRLCLVGRNGCGKSTLLKIASGLVEADSGDRFIKPGVTFRYLQQEPDLAGYQTCLMYVNSGLGPNDDSYKAIQLLEKLEIKPNENPNELSVGQARKCALAKVLAPDPDILFLDEPTNHLDLTMISWLEGYLGTSKAALVLVSHDRYFLKTLTQATLWIDRGQIHYLDKGFGEFETWRDKILAQESSDQKNLERKIHRENHWLIHGVTARRKRNQGRLRELQNLRKQHREKRLIVGDAKMIVSESKSSGRRVIETKSIFKNFESTPVIKDFSITIVRGERLGIIGSNGVGKSTLLKLLTGSLPPDAGQLHIGNTVELASLDQMRSNLNPRDTLSESLTVGDGDTVVFNGRSIHIHRYMKNFLFMPEQAGTPVKELSGGERARLMIAQALAKPSNLLVLDEPTNDLDVETLDVLQEMLGEYHGTVLIVSHDRDFLDRIVTSLVVLEGDGQWTKYAGGYTDMVHQKNKKPLPITSSNSKKKKSTDYQNKKSSLKSKLSYNDVYALETLPSKISVLEARIKELKIQLEAPDLYVKDQDKFKNTVNELQKAELRLLKMEEKWLALEILREELEG